jgi:hypothetical protein
MGKLKIFLKFAFVIILTLGVSIALQSLLAAWQAPAQNPPNQNLYEFINAGPATQAKSGSLGVGAPSPAEKMEIRDDTSNAARLRITDLNENPELQLQYGPGANSHWAIYSDRSDFSLKFWGGDANKLVIMPNGNVGLGMGGYSPNTTLDIIGAFSVREMSSPALSPPDQGRIYFDATANKFKVSENNGAYVDLVSTGSTWPLLATIDGTPAAPAYSWSSDSNTGIRRSDDNNLSFVTNGNDQVVITEDGNIGMGITEPVGSLHIYRSGGNNAKIALQSISGVNNYWNIYHDNNSQDLRFWNVFPNEKNIFTITNEGQVGISTTTPFSKMHLYDNISGPIISLSGLTTNYRGLTVRDTSNNEQWFFGPNNSNDFVVRRSGTTDYFNITSTGIVSSTNIIRVGVDGALATPAYSWTNDINMGIRRAAADNLRLVTSGSDRITIDATGNVGIGTTSPVSTLQVGQVNSGYFQFSRSGAGSPLAADCNANNQRGRMYIDTTNNRLYICNGASRLWDYISLTD